MKIIAGTSNHALAEDIAMHLATPLSKVNTQKFKDGEIYVQISENIRGDNVFIIQSTCPSVNDNLMELLIMIDALKRASAGKIAAVIPYYGYARQDRKSEAREPITAKLVADLITKAGASRVLTVDLHVPQIQGFFDIPVDEVSAIPLFAKYLMDKKLKDIVVVAPDIGATKRARFLAKRLGNCPIAIIDKRRSAHNQSEVMNIVGNIHGKTAVILDDIIDTGNSIITVADKIAEKANEVYVCATHPVFSGDCVKRLESSKIVEVIVTNTIPVIAGSKIKVLDLSKFLSLVIDNINNNRSVSELFNENG